MAERIVHPHNHPLARLAPLDRADYERTGFGLEPRGSCRKLPLVLFGLQYAHGCIESLGFTQHQCFLRFPVATMRYQRVIKFVMSQALGLWRIFHWPGMTPASREIAAREPFHTAQERNCCRLLARFILHNLVLG